MENCKKLVVYWFGCTKWYNFLHILIIFVWFWYNYFIFVFHPIPVAHMMAIEAKPMARIAKAHNDSSVLLWWWTWELLEHESATVSSSVCVDVRMSERLSARMRTDILSKSLSMARRRFSNDVVLKNPTWSWVLRGNIGIIHQDQAGPSGRMIQLGSRDGMAPKLCSTSARTSRPRLFTHLKAFRWTLSWRALIAESWYAGMGTSRMYSTVAVS